MISSSQKGLDVSCCLSPIFNSPRTNTENCNLSFANFSGLALCATMRFNSFWSCTLISTYQHISNVARYFVKPKILKENYHCFQCVLVKIQKQSLFTTSIMDRQLLRQKVRQKISVMKTNTGVFVVFKTKCELKCQNELFL